ncbi:MAG: WxL domain-containing protein [Acidimicrobiales bacterium]
MGILRFLDEGHAEAPQGSATSNLLTTVARRLVMVGALLVSTLVPLGGIVMTSSPAGAATCSGTAPITTCSSTGTLTLTGGTLTMTAPSSLAWGATINNANLSLVDATLADQGFQVDDFTGTGAGWKVQVSATPFTEGTGASSHSLANIGTFSVNGSTGSSTAHTAPTATCVTSGDCLVPTNTLSANGYPVAVTTAATPSAVTIYDTSANTGMGAVQIGGVGWWLNVPASSYAGIYTSTITLSITSGP